MRTEPGRQRMFCEHQPSVTLFHKPHSYEPLAWLLLLDPREAGFSLLLGPQQPCQSVVLDPSEPPWLQPSP